MAITLNSERQYALVAQATVNYTDIANYASAAAAETFTLVELPAGARILRVAWNLVTAFADDAAETQLIDLGTSGGGVTDNPDAFTATEIDADGTTGAAEAAQSEVGYDEQYTTPVDIDFTFTPSVGAAALTAGKIEVFVEYIVDGRGNENQG